MKLITKRFWLFYIIALIPFSVLAGMIMKYNQTGNAFHPTVVVPVFVIFLTSSSIGSLVLFMVKKASTFSQARVNKLIIPGLLIFYASAFFMANFSIALGDFAWFIFTKKELSGFMPSLHSDLIFANGRFALWLMFFTIAFFYILWQKSIRKEQYLREENLKHKFNTLKSQVNPHFLFNSLNVLSELVYSDPKKADNYIQTLSSIYRYVLENEETELITLDKELDFVRQFFSLQKFRDDDKIVLDINISKTEGIKVIPVSIQLLVENALKHNAMSVEQPLKISIYLENDKIIVSNPLQKKTILENSTQLGLQNLIARTKILLGSELKINNENNRFIVQLPFQLQK